MTAVAPAAPTLIRNRATSFTCPTCSQPVRKGQVFYSTGTARVHQECLADTAEKPATCTSCFMVSCDC